MSKYGVFSGPYFPTFWPNTDRYSVTLRAQSECEKIRTRKNSVFGHFSRSDSFKKPFFRLDVFKEDYQKFPKKPYFIFVCKNDLSLFSYGNYHENGPRTNQSFFRLPNIFRNFLSLVIYHRTCFDALTKKGF